MKPLKSLLGLVLAAVGLAYASDYNYQTSVALKFQSINTDNKILHGEILSFKTYKVQKNPAVESPILGKVRLFCSSELGLGIFTSSRKYYGLYFKTGFEYSTMQDDKFRIYGDVKAGTSKITEVSDFKLNYGWELGAKYYFTENKFAAVGYDCEKMKMNDGRKTLDGINLEVGINF